MTPTRASGRCFGAARWTTQGAISAMTQEQDRAHARSVVGTKRASAEPSHRQRHPSSRGPLRDVSDVPGIHLLQGLELVDTPRRSAVARLDPRGA